MNPTLLGLLRGLGTVILFAVITFFGDAVNLNTLFGLLHSIPVIGSLFTPVVAALVSSSILAWENKHAAQNPGTALFGSVKTR